MKKILPQHVAFIMDGNRRWAKGKGLNQLQGHSKGVDIVEPLVDYAMELGIKYLTFWAFSTENWRRQKREVQFLLKLFRENLSKKVDSFHRKNVKVHIIGNLEMFPKDLQEKTKEWMTRTKNNKKITVNVALSYGGRNEIIRAIHKLPNSKTVTKEELENYLDTKGQPDPDLLIRTGGARRLSGFMIWQMEDAEFYFTPVLWPDFTPREFDKALRWYQEQKRNFGK